MISIGTGFIDFSLILVLKSLLSVFVGEYGFVTVYFVMYAFSPFFNVLISNLDQKLHVYLVGSMFLVISIWQYLFPMVQYFGGHNSLLQFILLYVIAAYIRKYELPNALSNNVLLMTVLIGCSIINGLIVIFSNKFLNGFGSSIIFGYNSPIIVIISAALFLVFKNMHFNAKEINYTAKYVFGIYLIHDNLIIREILWNKLGIIEGIKFDNIFFFGMYF